MTARPFQPWAIALALLALCGGCTGGARTVSLAAPKRAPRASDYEEILATWTRSEKVISFKHLDTTLRVHATCFSPRFIAAYVARYAHLFRLSGRDRAAMERDLMAVWSRSLYFMVAASTTQTDWNDFEKEASVWRVSLVNDAEQQVTARRIEVKRKVTETTRDFFPYVGHFHRVYFFEFPRAQVDGRPIIGASTRSVTLRFNSPLGEAKLTWNLHPSSPAMLPPEGPPAAAAEGGSAGGEAAGDGAAPLTPAEAVQRTLPAADR